MTATTVPSEPAYLSDTWLDLAVTFGAELVIARHLIEGAIGDDQSSRDDFDHIAARLADPARRWHQPVLDALLTYIVAAMSIQQHWRPNDAEAVHWVTHYCTADPIDDEQIPVLMAAARQANLYGPSAPDLAVDDPGHWITTAAAVAAIWCLETMGEDDEVPWALERVTTAAYKRYRPSDRSSGGR